MGVKLSYCFAVILYTSFHSMVFSSPLILPTPEYYNNYYHYSPAALMLSRGIRVPRQDTSFIESPSMPSAPAEINEDQVELEQKVEKLVELEEGNQKEENEESAEEETQCPQGEWYHIRGERCVPLNCIGGNKFRDPETGECVIRRQGWQPFEGGRGKSFSRYNPRYGMKSLSRKGRLRFALPTKLKG